MKPMFSTLANIVNKLAGIKVLVIGDVMVDEYLHGDAVRISPEAPVPVVTVHRRIAVAGGAANTAYNIQAMGGKAFLFGIVGEDDTAAELCAILKRGDVDPSGLFAYPERYTSLKTRIIARGQQMLRIDREVTGPAFLPIMNDAILNLICNVDAVLFADYCKGVISEELARSVIAKARVHRKPIVVDSKKSSYEIFQHATILTPNTVEAEIASNRRIETKDDLLCVGQSLLTQLKVNGILITRGSEGMSLFQNEGPHLHLLSRARQVYDVTGAGDTVAAVTALALGAGADLESAVELANIAAGLVVEKQGTATVSPNELVAELSGVAAY